MQEKSIDLELKILKRKSYLSESASLRYLAFSALYISEGIPIGILFYAIPAWLAMNNVPPAAIASYVAVIMIPWSFKIILAPIIDRYTFLAMGRKRPWIIIGQTGLIISFLAIGFVNDPINNLNGLMVIGFITCFFGAIQDIAIDGMAVDIIPLHQQARANGIMWGSRIIGQSLSLLIGTALINVVGFSNAISSLSIVVAFLILVPIFFRERIGEKLLPWTNGKASPVSSLAQLRHWGDLLKSLLKVAILPASMFLGMGILITGSLSGLMTALLPIFAVQELSWSNTDFSHVYTAATLVGGCFGMLIGGFIIDLLGTKKMIIILLALITLLLVSFSIFHEYWSNTSIIYGFVILYYLFITFLDIAVLATAMKISWKKISATQFTLYMTLNNLGNVFGAWVLGYLTKNYSWNYIILTLALFPFLAIFIYKMIGIKKHLASIVSFEN